jgi:hypothetical protein
MKTPQEIINHYLFLYGLTEEGFDAFADNINTLSKKLDVPFEIELNLPVDVVLKICNEVWNEAMSQYPCDDKEEINKQTTNT